MKRLILGLIGLAVVLGRPCFGQEDVIRTPIGLARALRDAQTVGRPFEIEGQVTYLRTTDPLDTIVFTIDDGVSGVLVRKRPGIAPADVFGIGDVIRVSGMIERFSNGGPNAICQTLAKIRHAQLPEPITTTLAELLTGRNDYRLTRFSGVVRDAFYSRTNPIWSILVVKSAGETICVSMPNKGKDAVFFQRLVGARISLTGVPLPEDDGLRVRNGRTFKCASPDAIRVLDQAMNPPSGIPDIASIANLRPSEIAQLERHRATGEVIAVWQSDRALLRTPRGEIVRIEFAQPHLPAYGARIEAVGFPESDLYHINLARAIWHPLASSPIAAARVPEPPQDTTAAQLMTDRQGRTKIDTTAHGRAVRVRGIVRGLPGIGNPNGILYLEDGAYVIPVDASANKDVLADIAIGCALEVSGTCVLNVDSWRPNAAFPRINGFTIVIRQPEDIRILARPSWWTPGRLLTIVAVLLALLAGSFAWNRMLNRLVARRSHELLAEQVAHLSADLRVEERTRLAVELHDSIAQNLTGIAMELETAAQFGRNANSTLMHHLHLATRSLASSRAELRNCLWDLRNNALEEKDLNKAIEWTLLPYVKDISLKVEFPVPRNRFSDKPLHAVLSVIRELAVNGIRHGGATTIEVSGRTDGERLVVTVVDNGCGFDPDDCPGILQGHFGLQGIRERIRKLNGRLHIDSRLGEGTRAWVDLDLGTIHDGRKGGRT